MMTNFHNDTLKMFEEKFTYENSDGKTIIRYALCQNPETLNEDIKFFFTSRHLTYKELLIEKIEGKIITKDSHPFHANFEPIEGHIKGYNTALSDIINLIKEV